MTARSLLLMSYMDIVGWEGSIYSVIALLLLLNTLYQLRKIKPPESKLIASSPSLAVMICAYNEEKRISDLIQSLLMQTYSNFQIYIWNEECGDKTKQILNRFNSNRIKIYNSGTVPEGWNGKTWGQFQLAERTQEEYLLYVDADVRFNTRDAIEKLVQTMQGHPFVMAIPRLSGRGLVILSVVYYFLYVFICALRKGVCVHIWGMRRSRFPNTEFFFHYKEYYDDVFLSRICEIRPKMLKFTLEAEVKNYEEFIEAFSGVIRNINRFFPLWLTSILAAGIVIGFLYPFWILDLIAIGALLLGKLAFDLKHGLGFKYFLSFPIGLLIFLPAMFLSWILYTFDCVKYKGKSLKFARESKEPLPPYSSGGT